MNSAIEKWLNEHTNSWECPVSVWLTRTDEHLIKFFFYNTLGNGYCLNIQLKKNNVKK